MQEQQNSNKKKTRQRNDGQGRGMEGVGPCEGSPTIYQPKESSTIRIGLGDVGSALVLLRVASCSPKRGALKDLKRVD